MPNLTRNKRRRHKKHVRSMNVAPAAAGEEFYIGAYLCANAAGLAVRGGDLANARPLGVVIEPLFQHDPSQVHHHLDNRLGADGVVLGNPEQVERAVRYNQVGEYVFETSGSTPTVGAPAYLVDDDTVSADPQVNNVIAGHFTRPGPRGGWMIDLSRRGIA